MKRAVIYCRTSTTEESQLNALENQVQEASACVKTQGWQLVDSYVESGSGTTTHGRDQYKRLYEDLLLDRFDIIVIKSQDRLMRNVKDWYLFLDCLIRCGKQLYLYLEQKFYETEDGLIAGIKAILAEDYSRELSKKINNAHRNRQEKGGKVILTSKTFGFHKEKDGRVSIVEEEAEMVRRIFQYCLEGYGSRAIANIFLSEGKTNERGNYLSASAIRKIIRNPLYCGIAVMNRSHFDFDRKILMKNPEQDWISHKHAVPAIVDEKTWHEANEVMTSRARKYHQNGTYIKGSSPGKFCLSGKIICGKCKAPYYRVVRRKYKGKEKVIEWKCSSYLEHGRQSEGRRKKIRKFSEELVCGCDNVHLEEGILFQLLEQVSSKYYNWSEQERAGIMNRIMILLEKALSENPAEEELERLNRKKHDLERKKEVLLSKLLDAVISDEDYKKKRRELEQQVSEICKKEEALQPSLWEKENLEKRILTMKKRLEEGGMNQATVFQMLEDIDKIIVNEWELELCFDPLKIIGMNGQQEATGTFFGILSDQFTIRIPYPFSPETARGRYLDRVRIVELIKQNPGSTCKSIAGQLGRSVGMTRNRMEELIDQGVIRFEGAGGHGLWKVLKELPDEKHKENRGDA